MKCNHSGDLSLPKVYYFYMPALENKPAEVIEVLHGDNPSIQVPMRDEDKQLFSFYQRPLTTTEIALFGKRQTWQIFTSWRDMEEDHVKRDVPEQVLLELRKYKPNFSLPEAMSA